MNRQAILTLFLALALASCSASEDDRTETLTCAEQAPPCSSDCMTIAGRPIVEDCVSADAVELACAPEVIRNGLSSCARDDQSGVSYLLSSDTYRQLLEEKPNWFDCDGDWQNLLTCR